MNGHTSHPDFGRVSHLFPMRWSLSVAALALLTFCSPGRDRQNPETGGLSSNDTMATGGRDSAAPTGDATLTPAAILSQLNVANTTEIRLAGLAAKQAASRPVKQLARKLVADHRRNREQLQALAQKLNLNLTSAPGGQTAVADSTALPADLQGKSGAEFDKAFVRHEIEEHQANIEKIRSRMIPAAQNEQVRAYLQKTVTDLEGHLAALKQAEQQVGA
jgi:putative membrane protein